MRKFLRVGGSDIVDEKGKWVDFVEWVELEEPKLLISEEDELVEEDEEEDNLLDMIKGKVKRNNN